MAWKVISVPWTWRGDDEVQPEEELETKLNAAGIESISHALVIQLAEAPGYIDHIELLVIAPLPLEKLSLRCERCGWAGRHGDLFRAERDRDERRCPNCMGKMSSPSLRVKDKIERKEDQE